MAGYELNNIGVLDQLNFTYSNQQIIRGTFQGIAIHETVLDSDSFQLKALTHWGEAVDITLGAEYTQEQADTRTRADQDYYAGYLNFDAIWGNWSFSTGVRGNFWTAKQKLIDHRNRALTEELVGISGHIDAIEDQALTYAFGMIYSLTPSHNLSFNYSHTYRFPSLYERFAFDNFIGGGAALTAEKGHNFEWSWKYMDDPWFARASLFYSEFEDYLGTVPRRTLINPAGLQRCVERGRCDPQIGEYDDRENDFFFISGLFRKFG